MKLTAFGIILFFTCLNVSLTVNNYYQILPLQQAPYATNENIASQFVSINIDLNSVLLGGAALGVGIIGGYITGNLLAGGTVGLLLGAFALFSPIMKWAIFGVPEFLSQLQVPAIFTTAIGALISLVWFWFILGFISQRTMTVEG